MTKLKKVLFGCIGLYIFVALSIAHAQNDPGFDGPPRMHPGQRIQEIFSQLNLTDDQKKELETNKQENRIKMQRARQEMKMNKEAMQEELMKTQLDMHQIHVIHNRIKVLQSQMEDDKLNSILAVRAILTPEQFSKFATLMHKHKQEHDQPPSE